MIDLFLLLLPVPNDLLSDIFDVIVQVSHPLKLLLSDSRLHVDIELFFEFDRLLLLFVQSIGFLRLVIV